MVVGIFGHVRGGSWIEKQHDVLHLRSDLFEHFEPLRGHGRHEVGEPGGIATWAGQTLAGSGPRIAAKAATQWSGRVRRLNNLPFFSAKPIPLSGEPGDGRHLYEVELAARGYMALGQGWLSLEPNNCRYRKLKFGGRNHRSSL
jgi:hypothetical protein